MYVDPIHRPYLFPILADINGRSKHILIHEYINMDHYRRAISVAHKQTNKHDSYIYIYCQSTWPIYVACKLYI